MNIIDVVQPERIARPPDKSIILLSDGKYLEQGHIVKKVQMNLYIQQKNPKLGLYSLMTVHVETDKGSIEMTYDEGYRGEHALEEAVTFLTTHLGISGLILRAVMQLANSKS